MVRATACYLRVVGAKEKSPGRAKLIKRVAAGRPRILLSAKAMGRN
jgi:hypothetical protein